MPGVIDSTTHYVEHPELVAQRIEHYADAVGPERVIAATDCGMATFATADDGLVTRASCRAPAAQPRRGRRPGERPAAAAVSAACESLPPR